MRIDLLAILIPLSLARGAPQLAAVDGQAERPMSEYEQAAKPQPDEPPGPPLPRIGESTDLSFPDASGRTWSERDFRGKVVIAVLWSARCGPCVRELPEVQRLFERHRRDPSTLVVTLDLDDDPALPAVKDFLKGHDFTFPVLQAPVLLGRTGIPRTWIIDRRGILREDLRGAGPGWRQDMEHWIAALASPKQTTNPTHGAQERSSPRRALRP